MKYLVGKKGDILAVIRATPISPTFISKNELIFSNDRIFVQSSVDKVASSSNNLHYRGVPWDITITLSKLYADYLYRFFIFDFTFSYQKEYIKSLKLKELWFEDNSGHKIASYYFKDKEIEPDTFYELNFDISSDTLKRYLKENTRIAIYLKVEINYQNILATGSEESIYAVTLDKISVIPDSIEVPSLTSKRIFTQIPVINFFSRQVTAYKEDSVSVGLVENNNRIGTGGNLNLVKVAYRQVTSYKSDSISIGSYRERVSLGSNLLMLISSQSQSTS